MKSKPYIIKMPEEPATAAKPFPKLVMPMVSEQITTSGDGDLTGSIEHKSKEIVERDSVEKSAEVSNQVKAGYDVS